WCGSLLQTTVNWTGDHSLQTAGVCRNTGCRLNSGRGSGGRLCGSATAPRNTLPETHQDDESRGRRQASLPTLRIPNHYIGLIDFPMPEKTHKLASTSAGGRYESAECSRFSLYTFSMKRAMTARA